VCPCHGATFRLDGMPEAQPTYSRRVTPLPRIDVRVTGARVEVLVPSLA
jgi:nitrite reductase/ring-hydroxylating ferredoxin subunit